MKILKKIAIGFAMSLIVLVGGVFAFLYFFLPPFSDMCGNEVLAVYPSPSGKLSAVVFERDCGATTDFSTQVSIVRSGNELVNEGGNLFSADADHGRAPSGTGGGPEVRFRWLSDSMAELQHHSLVRVFRADNEVGDVQIVYKTF